MATPIRIKRSAVSGKRPALNQLQLGELALNTYDGYLFTERDTGGVGIGTTISLLTPWTENYGGDSIYYQNNVAIGTDNSENIALYVDGGLKVTGVTTFTDSVVFDSGTIQIPTGTGSDGEIGQIRYNTDLSLFEGYGEGNVWRSLGGVRDVDGDTTIRAEVSAGSDDDTIEIITDGEVRVAITSTGNVGIGTDIPTNSADTNNTTILNAGIVTANNYYGEGGAMTLGIPSDGSLTSGGALNTFSSTSSIVNSIDDLNELAFNIIRDTAVTNVDFTSDVTAGAATLNVTLTITSSGNADRFDIDWGDGETTDDTSDSTPSHAYTNVSGGSYTIKVTAKNSSGVGAGSSQSKTVTDFITVYTPAPVVRFDLYRALTGGSALSGNDLYVIEGNQLYLENNTINASGVGIGATYSIDWGDGTSVESINSDTTSGGSNGGRLVHTWGGGTESSTSRDTLTLTILKHDTTDPAEIPKSTTKLLKVYDNSPTDPDGLSSKTLSNVTSTGTSPKLASGFSDNTGGSTLSAGDSVVRVTTGTATAGPIGSFAYNADSGTLTAIVNGSADGSRSFTSGDDSGTYTSLIIDSESDYQLLNSSGSSVSFANSIYYPGLHKGFKARVSKSVTSLPVGINSMRIDHSITGNTNAVEFVKDYLTSTPSVNVSGATLTQNVAGTFRYISGIPYYNTGNPSLTLSGVTITNLTGECYTNQSNIVEVNDGTNQEGTSSDAITNNVYNYASIDGATTMLTGGIPNTGVGTVTGYSIGDLTIPVTSSNVRTVSRVKVRSRNVNGTGSYSNDIATNVQVHKASQSNISEIAIAVSDSLGETYDDDGVRIYDFKDETTDTPSYTSSTNFYTNQPYTESLTSSTVGINESIVRIGNIKFDQTDFSSGYLPVGPDRSSAPSKQYFTFAFRRSVVANFAINIASSGISGLWIAAPGTDIDDTSTLNGWLRADLTYSGSGIPGEDTANGGNGSNGCAATFGDRILSSTSLNGGFTMTLGEENMTNATGNVVLIRIALTSGQSISSLSIG